MLMMISLLMTFAVSAMDKTPITYGVAQEADISGILALYDQASNSDDKNKIVIMSPHMRQAAVRASIEKGRFFVAKEGAKVIAMKKAYLITDPEEEKDIFTNELCFNNGQIVEISPVSVQQNYVVEKGQPYKKPYQHALRRSIYLGGDYTDVVYRRRNINFTLSETALKKILPHCNGASVIALLFGLTEVNAERVSGIMRVFTKSLLESKVHTLNNPIDLVYYKTPASMPVFDEAGNMLPQDQRIPGFGNMLTYDRAHYE